MALLLYVDAFWSNSWDCAPYVALREKGVEFSTSMALLREGAGIVAPVRHQAITGLEPVLQHDDFWVAESMAIIEYVEEAFPPPAYPRLLPADLRLRARARQLMSWMRMELNDMRSERTATHEPVPFEEDGAARRFDRCRRVAHQQDVCRFERDPRLGGPLDGIVESLRVQPDLGTRLDEGDELRNQCAVHVPVRHEHERAP